VEHGFLAPVGRSLRGRRGRKLITLHNLASAAADQQAGVQQGRRRWLSSRAASAWRRVERQALRDFDVIVTVSDLDAALLGGPSVMVPNGVDCGRFEDTSPRGPDVVLFLGHLNFPPNADGLAWLAAEVWPHVRTRVPAAALEVVGRDPNGAVKAAVSAMAGAQLHADVPSVDPYLARASVSVVPLRFGTGTRLKALESLAAGLPLVGTTIGLGGLGIVDGVHALVRDTAEGIADGVAAVLSDPALRVSLSARGQALAREHYDWGLLTNTFVEAALGVAD
jgi:glycosyltransferase involved in cell wall biosynthesis